MLRYDVFGCNFSQIFVSGTIRAQLFLGLGFHAIAKEIHVIFPMWSADVCFMLTKHVYTALILDDVQSLCDLAGKIGAMSSRGPFNDGYRSPYVYCEGLLDYSQIAMGLMDMARGKSKKWA